MARTLHPGKNGICERQIPGVSFQLINEDAGVERDPAVTPQEKSQPLYSQVSRSL